MTNYFMNLMVKSRVRGRQGFTYMMMHLTCWNMQVCKDLFFKYRIFLSVESMIHDFLKIEFEHFFFTSTNCSEKGMKYKKSSEIQKLPTGFVKDALLRRPLRSRWLEVEGLSTWAFSLSRQFERSSYVNTAAGRRNGSRLITHKIVVGLGFNTRGSWAG